VSSAAAATTIGQTATPFSGDCSKQDRLMPTVSSGTSYVVPSTGGVTNWTVTSWSTLVDARPTPGQMKMKIFRPLGGTSWTVVGHSGPEQLQPGSLNTFPASLAVKSGDVLGLNPTTDHVGCAITSPADTFFRNPPGTDLADGQTGALDEAVAGYKLNISASLNPVNDIKIDSVTNNKKRGTATLSVDVPNPGTLTLSGTGLKPVSTSVDAATTAALKVKAKGHKKSKLNNTGKVKVSAQVSFTPTGGDKDSATQPLKLKKK
jgi:hypothetical protein